MNNWSDLVAIRYSSQLNYGYPCKPEQGPRLGEVDP
jgi:hypothetical protein